MLTLKDFKHVLVSYYKNPDKLVAEIDYSEKTPKAMIKTIKGQKRGVLVAIGPGVVGWSLCNVSGGWNRKGRFHNGDVFNKSKGLDLALRRAKIAESLDLIEIENFYAKVPFSLQSDFDKMMERSYQYFQIPDEE